MQRRLTLTHSSTNRFSISFDLTLGCVLRVWNSIFLIQLCGGEFHGNGATNRIQVDAAILFIRFYFCFTVIVIVELQFRRFFFFKFIEYIFVLNFLHAAAYIFDLAIEFFWFNFNSYCTLYIYSNGLSICVAKFIHWIFELIRILRYIVVQPLTEHSSKWIITPVKNGVISSSFFWLIYMMN